MFNEIPKARFLWRTDFSITTMSKTKWDAQKSAPLSDMASKASSVSRSVARQQS
jgi:hypothetical protein